MDTSARVGQNLPAKKMPERKDDGKQLPKGKTMLGTKPDDIIVNPVMEDKNTTAVVAFGRFNPPTTGHEKLIHHVEKVAKEHGGTAHIIASHSEGTGKDPLPQDKKLGYLNKVVSKGTKVHGSSKQSPSLLHHAAALHAAGHQHLVMVAGSDRVPEYHALLHKYNGVEGKHGHYNFKSIKVVSAGHRDPDAEGTTGMSGTKMRALARAGDHEGFKKGLPKSLHPHAKEIMGHIQSVKEDYEIDTLEALYDAVMEQEQREVLARKTNKRFSIFARELSRKDNSAMYKQQEIQKKIIDESFKKQFVRVLPGAFARTAKKTGGQHDEKTNTYVKGNKTVGHIKGTGFRRKYYLDRKLAIRHKVLRLESTDADQSE